MESLLRPVERHSIPFCKPLQSLPQAPDDACRFFLVDHAELQRRGEIELKSQMHLQTDATPLLRASRSAHPTADAFGSFGERDSASPLYVYRNLTRHIL